MSICSLGSVFIVAGLPVNVNLLSSVSWRALHTLCLRNSEQEYNSGLLPAGLRDGCAVADV